MTDSVEFITEDPRFVGVSGKRVISLILVSIMFLLAPAMGIAPPAWGAGLIAIGLAFLGVVAVILGRDTLQKRTAAQTKDVLAKVLENQDAACFVADIEGNVLLANTLASSRFQAVQGSHMAACLRSIFANPAAILVRLQSLAQEAGYASEDIATRGVAIPVAATWLNDGMVYWRVDLQAQQSWNSIQLPVLNIGRNDVILHANEPARRLLSGVPPKLEHLLPPDVAQSGGVTRLVTVHGPKAFLVTTLRQKGLDRALLLAPLEHGVGQAGVMSFSDLPVPIMRLSLQGEILEANRLASRLIGDLLPGNTNIDQMMQGLNRPIEDWLAQTAEQDTTPHTEILRLKRQDKETFVQVTLSRILRDGEPCLIAVLNDATELKTLEAQFVQGQKMQAVGQLAGGVAHDFNNLLTAISGHCDLLLLRHDQSDANYSDLVQINQNANRAAALVSQLLAFSRKQTLRPEMLDLRDTISDLIHLLNRLVGEKVRLILSHDPVLKPVRADKRQLEQVLMNLVVNAGDAMPEGGEIRIETEILSLDQPLTRDRATVPVGEYVTVKVIDSGTGIAVDKLQKIFEPFFTTKRTGEGTGLGLSTVYGIVKQTGGFIFVDSVVGQGSEFTVYLPVSVALPEETPKGPATVPDLGGRQGEGVVLLVEDEAPVRAFATRALRLKGYTVLEADSAEAALTLLEDKDLSVDVFVTDVVMPGMDGPTWVSQALKTRPEVQVIFMSGYAEGAFGEAGPQVENSTFLPKPFSLNQLTEAVFQRLN
ncbi:ATP-binding protein [Ruegeria sp. HKCCD7255]|uniref:hybrid sensor histidine kinase/response regulator n=1 Tax=Ruegeria sp. HKCCD7255 TaxID=2683004 RepID=UPI00148804D4|nr:ATP-binding protein [Ruegeria sp. HKCCD7255]